jgi:Urocanase Rossmann-like domain
MPPDFTSSPQHTFALRVLGVYSSLIASASSISDPSLGGKLLYAGPLDEGGRALIVAANIAGAASLCVAPETSTQKQAIRDGVIDFLVNSLDEALRILKNEIRKREPVAVCVATTLEALEAEMFQRGVLPDLRRPIPKQPDDSESVLVSWTVASAPTKWLPKLDAIALDSLGPNETTARRWLRFAPRYLGRLAQNVRLLSTNPETADTFFDCVKSAVLPVIIHFHLSSPAGFEAAFHFPSNPTES